MALISCPDCGARVSDATPQCLSCGRPIATPAIVTQTMRAQVTRMFAALSAIGSLWSGALWIVSAQAASKAALITGKSAPDLTLKANLDALAQQENLMASLIAAGVGLLLACAAMLD